ncbi:DUF6004 family protein [Nonomuraea sp. NPDC000554]|uniref:DUF6004 family protein n=1 Tax=Nonomuraea sp. NPDC000554 TaxID=3154259 RepID=UPI0033310C93
MGQASIIGAGWTDEFRVPGRPTIGEGYEDSLSRARFPSDLHIDAEFEIVSPAGALYAANTVHLGGKLKDLEPAGSEQAMAGVDTPLLSADETVKARLTGVRFTMRDAFVDEHAAVNV